MSEGCKLTYEEWKEKYCAKINQQQLDYLKSTHGLENPQDIIDQYNLEAYKNYIDPINPDLLDFNSKKNWLELLGDIQQNESVDNNYIVREIDLHKFKILWSFENNSQAREAFKQWNEQYDDYYNNPENYKS